MTAQDDWDKLHEQWAELKRVVWAERWTLIPLFILVYLIVVAVATMLGLF